MCGTELYRSIFSQFIVGQSEHQTLSRVFDKTMLNRGVGSRGMSPSSLKNNNYFIPPIRSVILLIICINKVMLAGQYKIFSSTIRGIDGISPKNRERNDLSLLFDSIKL